MTGCAGGALARFQAARFARRNPLDRALYPRKGARIGIVTSGKAYSDVREALDELGIDERRAGQLRISILKIGLAWPIEPEGARAFCEGLEEVIVVEEKRSVIEERAAISHTAIAQAAPRRQERPGGSVALLLLQVVVVLAFGVETKPMPLEMLEEGTAGGGMLQPATVAESR